MNFQWITATLVSVLALSGCRTVQQPLQTANRARALSPIRSAENPDSKPGGYMVRQVTFQQPESIDEGNAGGVLIGNSGSQPSDLQNPAQQGVVTVAQDQVQLVEASERAFTLADLEQMAISFNPSLAAANATVAKSRGFLRQVGIGPNPTVGYSGNQLADQATDQHTMFVQKQFVRGNKLELNREVLRHTTEAQAWEIETQRYRVLTDVRVRFYEAIAAQRQLDATIEFAKIANRGLGFAVKLQEAGEGTLIDVMQSKTLLSETNLAIERSRAAYEGAWKDLAAIAGRPDFQPARLIGDFETPSIDQDWDAAYAFIIAQSPELASANSIVCEKRAFLKRQQVQTIPNVTAQIGAGYDRSTDNGLINMNFGVPIPVRNKNRGRIAAACADLTRAIEEVNRIEMAIKSRLARTAQEFESANASVQKYEQEILPQVNESLVISEKAYAAGELAFLQVLIVRRNYFDSTIRYIQAQGQLAQASSTVNGLLLTGGLDSPKDYTKGVRLRGQTFGGQ